MPFQKIYIPHPQKGLECPMGVVVVVEGDGGGLGSRPKHLTKCMDLHWNFQMVWGVFHSVEKVFSETTQ